MEKDVMMETETTTTDALHLALLNQILFVLLWDLLALKLEMESRTLVNNAMMEILTRTMDALPRDRLNLDINALLLVSYALSMETEF